VSPAGFSMNFFSENKKTTEMTAELKVKAAQGRIAKPIQRKGTSLLQVTIMRKWALDDCGTEWYACGGQHHSTKLVGRLSASYSDMVASPVKAEQAYGSPGLYLKTAA
jgi:hypothetical protein